MTGKQKDAAKLLLGIPAALIPLAGILFWLGNTAFVSKTEFAPVRADVDTLQSDMRELKSNVQLSVCLQLAEKQGRPWQECVK